jgi:hypothetical protein
LNPFHVYTAALGTSTRNVKRDIIRDKKTRSRNKLKNRKKEIKENRERERALRKGSK